jgi:hypothetical protein
MKAWFGLPILASLVISGISPVIATDISKPGDSTKPEKLSDSQKPDISLGDGIQSGAESSDKISFSDALKQLEEDRNREKGEFEKALEAMGQAGGKNADPVLCRPLPGSIGIGGGGGSAANSLCSPQPEKSPNPEKEAILKTIGELKPAEMVSRLVDLELRLNKLEASRNTVQAPFTVVDKNGRVILSVSTSGQGNDYLVMGATGEPGIFLQRNAEYARLTARVSADNRAYLNADHSKGATAAAEHANYASGLGTSMTGGHGLFVREIAGQSVNTLAEIADQPGKKVALRLYNEQGKAVVSAGINPATGGSGTVMTANTKGENVAFLGTSEDGESGILGVAKKGKNTAALLSEPRMVVLYNDAGEAITTLAKSQEGNGEGGNITIRQPDGEGIFSAGYSEERGGGEACVYRAKKQNVFCLGIGVPGMGTGH